MATLTKKRPANSSMKNALTNAGRKRGGEFAREFGDQPAATKTNRRSMGDSKPNPNMNGDAAGVDAGVNAKRLASRKNNGRSDAVLSIPKKEMNGHGGNGERVAAIEKAVAGSRQKQAACGDNSVSNERRDAMCRDLQSLQRRRVTHLKARIAIDNQLAAIVATELGYHAGMEEADRKARRAEAVKLIEAIDAGDECMIGSAAACVSGIVLNTKLARNGMDGTSGFNGAIKAIEKEMAKLAASLHVAEWVKSVRGFGLGNLAIIVGECGDLSLYANPGKVWRRMGCAPFKGKMGSTWKRKGGLSAEDWSEFGYSPRRRAIAFCLADTLIKGNDGVYRKRYDDVKAAKMALNDEAWPKLRCHLHASLLTAKMALRDLWVEWNK